MRRVRREQVGTIDVVAALARAAAVFIVAAATLVVSGSSPVAAGPALSRTPSGTPSDAERLAAYDEALVAVTQELSYLVLLGWVETPIPAAARDLPASIGIAASDPAAMVDELRFLDGQRGPAALAVLVELGEPLTEPVRAVLAPNLPPPDQGIPRIGVGVYLTAYDALLVPWAELRGLADAPASTVAAPRPVLTAPPATDVRSTGVPASDASDASDASVAVDASVSSSAGAGSPERSDGSSTTIGLVAGAALVAAGSVTAVVMRRRRSRRGPPVHHDEVVDAGRTIMAAVDLDAFGRTVAAQVQRLTGVDAGAVLHGRSWTTGRRPMPSNDDLTRVLSTARPLTTATATIVPVVADGTVVGALVAWDAPPSATDVIGSFAPLVGAALQGLQTRLTHEHLAFDDSLTGVGNRRRFDRDLEQLLVAGARRGPVSLAMVDVDHFKRFNDTHGHPAGDLVLRHVADVIRAHVRAGDVVYRYGGEEFAVLLPGADLDEAMRVVERVRAAVAASPLPGEVLASVAPVTVSVGVSAAPPVDAASMVRAADGALYEAKSAGRNRVSAYAAG